MCGWYPKEVEQQTNKQPVQTAPKKEGK